MTTDDLRTRALRQADRQFYDSETGLWCCTAPEAFAEGALWHAAQQPSREQIARVLLLHPVTDHAADTLPEIGALCESAADAVLALRDGSGSWHREEMEASDDD